MKTSIKVNTQSSFVIQEKGKQPVTVKSEGDKVASNK